MPLFCHRSTSSALLLLASSSLGFRLPSCPNPAIRHHAGMLQLGLPPAMCAADGATETSDDSIGSLPREVPESEWDGETILTCAKCKAAFMIDVEAFGTGREVSCSTCNHEWYQTADRLQKLPGDMKLVTYPESMKERIAQGKSAEPQSNFRAFVGNMPFQASAQELEDLFSPYGVVCNVNIMTDEDGRPRGFAFVNMEDPKAGLEAVAALDGVELRGRNLNVSEGKQPAGRGRGRGDGRGRGRGDFRGRGRGDGRGPRGRGDFRGRGEGRGDFRGRGRG